MPIFWLSDYDISFPHPTLANEDGMLAVGGDLSPKRLLLAYELGIFPWFNPGDPILWWSPDPRFVLFPKDLKVSKSMRPYFNQKKFGLSLDKNFEEVMRACQQQKRKGQLGGTWITEGMIEGYCKLHEMGYAHSIEVWDGEDLVGGLYGVAIGKCFFGESMFAKKSNASKFGFISFVKWLHSRGFWLIDCQQETRHLASLGAKSIPRVEFLDLLEKNNQEANPLGSWNGLLK